MHTYAQVDGASGRPINYQPAHVIGWWEEAGRFFTGFGTGRSDVTFTATASHSPNPQDTSSYIFEEVDLSQIELTPAEIDQLLESFAAAGIEPPADDVGDTGSPVGEEQTTERSGDDTTATPSPDAETPGGLAEAETEAPAPAEVALDVNVPAGDAGDGFEWVPVLIGSVVVLGTTYFLFMWMRKPKDDGVVALADERPESPTWCPEEGFAVERDRQVILDIANAAEQAGAQVDGGRFVHVDPGVFFADNGDCLAPQDLRTHIGYVDGSLLAPIARQWKPNDVEGRRIEIDKTTGCVYVWQPEMSAPGVTEGVTPMWTDDEVTAI